MRFLAAILSVLGALAVPQAAAAADWPTQEGKAVLRDFRFHDGTALPQLTMHYTTLGTPRRDAQGRIDNAVMVLHGTGGSGAQFLQPQFADELYGPGQPLDIRRYFIILPDNIGHGQSSKPSDGLRSRFPAYNYADMVEAQRQMLASIGVTRLRLVMGTSMGCMHIFVWGETHPDFARAAMPMACLPIEIAGLNRTWRQLAIDGIKADPAWKGGDYTAQPLQGLRTAQSLLIVAGGAPLWMQRELPTRDKAVDSVRQRMDAALPKLDANDLLYALDASRDYDPWPGLEKIRVPVTWLNSADDFINPRNLDVPQRAVARMKDARFRMIEESDETRGHSTHTWARFWKGDLSALLARTR